MTELRDFAAEYKLIMADYAYNIIGFDEWTFKLNSLHSDYIKELQSDRENEELQEQARASIKSVGQAELQRLKDFDKNNLSITKQTEFQNIQSKVSELITALDNL